MAPLPHHLEFHAEGVPTTEAVRPSREAALLAGLVGEGALTELNLSAREGGRPYTLTQVRP